MKWSRFLQFLQLDIELFLLGKEENAWYRMRRFGLILYLEQTITGNHEVGSWRRKTVGFVVRMCEKNTADVCRVCCIAEV